MNAKEALREARKRLLKTQRERTRAENQINRKGAGYGNIIVRGKRKKKAPKIVDVLIAAAGRSTGNSGERGETINSPEEKRTGGQ